MLLFGNCGFSKVLFLVRSKSNENFDAAKFMDKLKNEGLETFL